MGVIASGRRIAWHMGPFGGVWVYCVTVQVVQCRAHSLYSHQGKLPHLTSTTQLQADGQPCSSSFAQHLCLPLSLRGGGGGGARNRAPPPSCHLSKPVWASRVATAQAAPRLGSYRSTRSALGTALFAKTCRTSTRMIQAEEAEPGWLWTRKSALQFQDRLSQDEPAMKQILQNNNTLGSAIAGHGGCWFAWISD